MQDSFRFYLVNPLYLLAMFRVAAAFYSEVNGAFKQRQWLGHYKTLWKKKEVLVMSFWFKTWSRGAQLCSCIFSARSCRYFRHA